MIDCFGTEQVDGLIKELVQSHFDLRRPPSSVTFAYCGPSTKRRLRTVTLDAKTPTSPGRIPTKPRSWRMRRPELTSFRQDPRDRGRYVCCGICRGMCGWRGSSRFLKLRHLGDRVFDYLIPADLANG